MGTLPLGAALKRGGLLVAANWAVVLLDFSIGLLYMLVVAVPVLGGALMVSVLGGRDLRDAVTAGIGPTADVVLGSLASAPVALLAFLGALAAAAIGAEAIAFIVKSGTLAVIVEADRGTDAIEAEPIGTETLLRAQVFRLETVVVAARHFARRSVTLALGLGSIYGVLALAYVGLVTYGVSSGPAPRWAIPLPVLVFVATSLGIVSATAATLTFNLLRVVLVTDDCDVREAVSRLRVFVIEDARQVLGIFSVVGGVELFAGAAALLATAGLAPIAYLPFAGLLIVPLQLALWVLRGLLFEALSLASLSAYQTQYRRFSRARWG